MTNDLIAELANSQNVVIVLPKNPSIPAIASGLALSLSLKKQNRQVDTVCQSEMTVEANNLVGVQHISPNLPGRNLVISFNYAKDSIDKVSYNVENGKFNLIVIPKSGNPPLNSAEVEYSYSGINDEIVIIIGSSRAEEAGFLPGVMENKKIFCLIPGLNRSLASETAQLIASLDIMPDEDIANNLMLGLISETNHFQTVNAADFETAAALLRAGAKLSPQEPIVANGQFNLDNPISEKSQEASKVKTDWLKQPKIFRSGESN
ncbi:hypothetical protein HZB78_01460 [Candidatus Collierbacteria bacterium]|nr:hypothetical protein [Candidatus Collierbacteria bacterium]